MTGLVARTGWSIRSTRTGIELAVLAVGAALGGKVGIGTLIYAVGIGPLAQLFMRLFRLPPRERRARRELWSWRTALKRRAA